MRFTKIPLLWFTSTCAVNTAVFLSSSDERTRPVYVSTLFILYSVCLVFRSNAMFTWLSNDEPFLFTVLSNPEIS